MDHPIEQCDDVVEAFERVRRTGRPLVVSRDGEAQAVILTPHEYDQLCDEAKYAEVIRALDESQAQFERGEHRPAREFFREFAAKHGIPLD